MKSNKIYQALSLGFIALALMFVCGHANAQSSIENVSLSLTAEKDSYALGEVVDLRFHVKNLSEKSLEIAKPNVGGGNLKLYISEDGNNFREYVGPNWGIAGNAIRPTVKLESESTYEVKATMLYNHRVPTEHLTELYAERIRRERIDSEFALPNPGRYFLKAVFTDAKTRVESEPYALDISEPIGLDAAVWEKMKNDGAFAYFLHTGEVTYQADSAAAGEFVEKLRQISRDYPDTTFAAKLNERLIKYKRDLENLRKPGDEQPKEN